ncbi:MAG: signal recognition particle protein [Neomegalonema sp.]|nr:signal recognition particle protein [Neomegalonema sp.]
MFEALSERLSGVFDKLTRQGALTEADVQAAMREVRVALLDADVALPVARDFIGRVKSQAIGAAVLKSVTPGQMVIKIVHDELIKTLAGDDSKAGDSGLRIDSPPAPVLMVGLQGSGKTTTTGKLAKRLKERYGKKVLMASLDVYRPAAMDQLAVLGQQIGVDTLPIVKGEMPVQIAKRAKQQATLGGYDAYLLDTAGRLHINEELMAEVEAVREVAQPHETLLVVDSLTGQDAVNVAKTFNERVSISGVVLTRMDGDGRGGAALSMRAVTGKPIKFVGVGEKMDGLEEFHADRVAGRILGMGDIVTLVEKAAETMEREAAERQAKRMMKGRFDMNDLRKQLEQMQQLGGMSSVMSMLPGLGKMAKQLEEGGVDDKVIKRQIAIIQSMTKDERKRPDMMAASRKKRVAAGSGMQVQDVNKLLKMHRQMQDMMKKMGKMGKQGFARGLASMMGMGGGAPGMPAGAPGALPGGAPGLPLGGASAPTDAKAPGGALPGLGGLPTGAGLPGLGGLPTPPGGLTGLGGGKPKKKRRK